MPPPTIWMSCSWNITGTGNHSYRHRETFSYTGQKEQSVSDGGVCPHTRGRATYVVCWKQHGWCCNTSGCVISECVRVCVGTQRGQRKRALVQKVEGEGGRRDREIERERERERGREQPQTWVLNILMIEGLWRKVKAHNQWKDETVCVNVKFSIFDSLFVHKYTCDGGGCVTQYAWGTCVDLSPGYLYDGGAFTEVESIQAVKSRGRVYKRECLHFWLSICSPIHTGWWWLYSGICVRYLCGLESWITLWLRVLSASWEHKSSVKPRPCV